MSKTISKGASALNTVVAALQSGHVVLLPTDTVYGLVAVPYIEQAKATLYRIKQRPIERDLPLFVADAQHLDQLGVIYNDNVHKIMASPFVPGALTVIVRLDQDQKPTWLVKRTEIAFRIPKDPFLIQILRATGPLLATSANRHNAPTKTNLSEILTQLAFYPDLIVNGGECAPVPSTIVNCCYSKIKFERIGAVSKETIQHCI